MSRRGFDATQVRQLCADVAEIEGIYVEEISKKKKSKSVAPPVSNNHHHSNSPSKNEPLPDIVTMAIIMGECGKPVTAHAYTEGAHHDHLQSSDGAILSRIPALHKQEAKCGHSAQQLHSDKVKPLKEVILHYLSVQTKDKLMKRMPPVLLKLKTTDFNTARSFIKLDRYAEVRKEICLQLDVFVSKDLKMRVVR